MTEKEYRQLLRSFPRLIAELADGQTTLLLVFMALAFLAVLVGRSSDLWMIGLSSFLGPTISLSVFLWRPMNPYDNMYARLEGKTTEKASRDPYARELMQLLGSRPAKVYVAKTAGVLALTLFGISVVSGALRGPISLSFDSSRDLGGILGYTLGLFGLCTGVEGGLVLRWSLRILKRA